jgi:hypothetical protein
MISWTLMKYTWKEFASRNVRLILFTVIFLFPLAVYALQVIFSPEMAVRMGFVGADSDIYWVLLFGTGVIGIRASRGTLPLILARPVTTVSVVLSSWLAVSIAAFLSQLALLLVGYTQAFTINPCTVSPPQLAAAIVSSLLLCFSMSAVVVFFSTVVSGVRDLGILGGVFLLGALCKAAEAIQVKDIQNDLLRMVTAWFVGSCSAFGEMLFFFVMPRMEVHFNVVPRLDLPVTLISILAVTTVALSLAIARLNTMELSYATE